MTTNPPALFAPRCSRCHRAADATDVHCARCEILTCCEASLDGDADAMARAYALAAEHGIPASAVRVTLRDVTEAAWRSQARAKRDAALRAARAANTVVRIEAGAA